MKFRVYGQVRGQARPRTSFKNHIVYKRKEDREFENRIKEAYINAGGINFGDKPIKLTVITHRELPQSRPKRIESELDIFKPDASNILKAVEDALNGIAYNDDKQILDSRCIKANRERGSEFMDIEISVYQK
jgi:Holliday junction resolvase RusA-like endonuclease